MHNIIFGLMIAIYSVTLPAQTIPFSLTFSMYSTKVTIGRSNEDAIPKKVCMQVLKKGTDVRFFFCNDEKAERTYRITEVQKEPRESDMYIMQYYGFEYFDNDPVPSFLSYSLRIRDRKMECFIRKCP